MVHVDVDVQPIILDAVDLVAHIDIEDTVKLCKNERRCNLQFLSFLRIKTGK